MALTRAHIDPRRDGGAARCENLFIACPHCNYHVDREFCEFGRDITVSWVRDIQTHGPIAPRYLLTRLGPILLGPKSRLNPLALAVRESILLLLKAVPAQIERDAERDADVEFLQYKIREAERALIARKVPPPPVKRLQPLPDVEGGQ